MDPVVAYLGGLLSARIRILHAQAMTPGGGFRLPEAVVPTPRLLLALKGEARYTVNGRTFHFRAPMQLLVAGQARRRWDVPPGVEFSIAWVEFQVPSGLEPPSAVLIHAAPDAALERACFERIRRLCALGGEAHRLWAEGEFKSVLARFLANARRARTGRGGGGPGRRGVELAAEWLGAHFARPDAMAGLHVRADLSPNHFRLLFRRLWGVSPRRYLTVLRMRAARGLLREGRQSVKEIAHATGFDDPLYFSRLYRRFWGVTPTDDR